MLQDLILEIGVLPFYTRLLLTSVIVIFMPLSAMTFFFYMLDKKEKDFHKAMRDMGIHSSRKVRDTYKAGHYLLPVAFVTMVCLVAILLILFADLFVDGAGNSLILTGADFATDNNLGQAPRSLVAFSFAFLGGFIWSANNIIRRLINYDLSPNNYYTAGIRIFLAVLISIILAFLLPEWVGPGLPAISFLAGMFPERVLHYLIDKYKDFINGNALLDEQMSLENIEGISVQHKERLEEIGIDNAQNLATTSFIQLLIKTPFETRELLDWIGQAKLLLYVKDNIVVFREIGIRSVFDFFKGDKSKEVMQQIAEFRGIDPMMMGLVYEQVINDEGIRSLYEFQRQINLPDNSANDYEHGGDKIITKDVSDTF